MEINSFFDKVYLLNLDKRSDRLELSNKRFNFCDIRYERFSATDGNVIKPIWKSFCNENSYFSNPNYLACAISHLSIYEDALTRGYEKILVVEDDNRIHRTANKIFSLSVPNNFSESSWDLLYLGFIPLTDDRVHWNYNVFEFTPPLVKAKNFWGLYGYGISSSLMKETLAVYDESFPMELDRYFVTQIQPRNRSFGIVPQIFAAEDGISDNSGALEIGMLERSTDARVSKLHDYI